MRRHRTAWCGLAGIVLAAVTAAPAMAGAARAAQPGATVKARSASSGSGPFVSEFVKEAGAAAIRNQAALGTFRSWVIRQPGLAGSGYVGSIDDLAHKAMTVMWHGPRTPLLAAIIRAGQQRGIAVTVQHRKYSLQQLNAAIAAIWKQAAEGQWAGFHVSAIAAVSAAAGEGLTVDGAYTAVPAAKRAAWVRSLATVVRGVPVRLAPGRPVTPVAGRDADLAPFNAGGLMLSYHTGTGCSSGFAIVLNGQTHTTTARHCTRNDYVDALDTTGGPPPPVSQWYGDGIGTSPDGGARILGNTGFYWMFNRGWNSITSSTVIGYQDLGLNDLVCTEGGNSGEHCNVKVTNLLVSWNDGHGGAFATIQGYQQTNGAIAVVQGDSGGPVMSLVNTSSGQVRAAGMIQAQGNALSTCPSTYTFEPPCSRTVYFSSMRTIVDSIPGAALYTG